MKKLPTFLFQYLLLAFVMNRYSHSSSLLRIKSASHRRHHFSPPSSSSSSSSSYRPPSTTTFSLSANLRVSSHFSRNNRQKLAITTQSPNPFNDCKLRNFPDNCLDTRRSSRNHRPRNLTSSSMPPSTFVVFFPTLTINGADKKPFDPDQPSLSRALIGGLDAQLNPLFICRAKYGANELIPGQLMHNPRRLAEESNENNLDDPENKKQQQQMCLTINAKSTSILSHEKFQILMRPKSGSYKWTQVKKPVKRLPSNLILGGVNHATKSYYYIARCAVLQAKVGNEGFQVKNQLTLPVGKAFWHEKKKEWIAMVIVSVNENVNVNSHENNKDSEMNKTIEVNQQHHHMVECFDYEVLIYEH